VVSKIEADWGAEQAYGPSGTDEVRTDINQKMAGELFADHLLLTLVYSHRPGHEFVMERTLEQWGVTFQQACEVAVRNLDRRTKQPFEPIADGVYTARYNDGFDASRIFLLDRFAQCQLKGDPVAVFPQRDAIVFTGSEDQAGLEMVFKLTSTVQSIGLLNSPFVLADQKWQLFRVPNTHASSETIAVSNLCDLLKIYGEQTSIIERGLKRQQMAMTPVPIATLKHDGCQHVTTVAVWTADAPNPLLLPYAEQIAFIPHGSTTFSHVADFDHVLQELPELLTALKCYPERFLVRQYPSPDQFAKLGILKRARSIVSAKSSFAHAAAIALHHRRHHGRRCVIFSSGR
jgi:hypothetical protein